MVQAIQNLDNLAILLGVPKFILTRYIFQADSFYKVFRIRKRSGHGYRIISAPSSELKGIQRWISVFILRKIPLPDECVGFRIKRSICDNASPHVKKDFVLHLDMEDFFPTITIPRVVGLFKEVGYTKEVAFGLGKLTTYKNKLPQGAPSSPSISNIICRKLDYRIKCFCDKRGWSYTRYCDDMTISGMGNMPSKNIISKIIRDEGFKINQRKTSLMRRNTCQRVTGLVVNDGVNISKHRKKIWRAIFHQASLTPDKFYSRRAELLGYIEFLKMVCPTDPSIATYTDIIKKLDLIKSI